MPTKQAPLAKTDSIFEEALMGDLNLSPQPMIRGITLAADGYDDLAAVLAAGFEQAAYGKGKERHANSKPFNRQPLLEVSRMTGLAFPTGQAMKKLQEANTMAGNGATNAAIRELHGAIVYAAAAIILLEEQQ